MATASTLLSPALLRLRQGKGLTVLPEDLDDRLSDVAESGSQAGSMLTSVVSDSRKSGTTGNYSAFTAPPRYRNSGVFVHGTKFRNFASIMEQGLKAAKSEIFMIDEVRADGRVPGLRDPPQILIFIDENKARSFNMEFEYDSTQGTWKTKGINGVIRPWFFQKVVDQRKGPGRGNVLFQSKEDPIMQANVIRQRPQYLIHATYWENVVSIMHEGIVPAKNPLSSFRKPFKELLQGAESHVYTVSMSSMSSSSRPEPDSEARQYKLDKDTVGLERPPDAFVVIDTKKVELNMVQSADREEHVFVRGPVPVEALRCVQANEPVNLPADLKASIVHRSSDEIPSIVEASEPVNLPADLKASIVDPRSFDEIPIIDLTLDEPLVVERFRYACEVVGFMQVVGHGISVELQQRHMELQRRFFQLPEEVKARLALRECSPVRGYFGKGGEDLDRVLNEEVDSAEGKKLQQSRKDNKEALDTNGVPWSKPRGGYIAEIFGHPSSLPTEEELPGFREVLEAYACEMFRISRKILRFLALVLGREPDLFEPYLTEPVATHRLLHYWPIKDFKTQIGVGEHSDYGLLTVLKQDSVGGLQVLNARDSRWVHCCPVNNAFVVNLGDMMSRWTAGRFKSTIHRVVNVSPEERFSVPYFLEPNMDALIDQGGLCDGPAGRNAEQAATAETILERFYRASGQLKFKEPEASKPVTDASSQ